LTIPQALSEAFPLSLRAELEDPFFEFRVSGKVKRDVLDERVELTLGIGE
jgi:hypothetical protein